MTESLRSIVHLTPFLAVTLACSPSPSANLAGTFVPSEIVDLGAVVTEDLPERIWGKAFLTQMGFTRPNRFDVIKWTLPVEGDSVSGSNAYYTLFNHGGPHVDAPNHMGAGEGLDSYPLDAFSGPAKVFDVRSYPDGRSVPADVFRGNVDPGDVVLLVTGYEPPQTDDAIPEAVTLTHEAAEFLATLPIRAFGTDGFSVESLGDLTMPLLHLTLLSRGIPVYEQLFNVDQLLGRRRMHFVGVPLNIKDGDGMIVRPVVFVY